MSIPTTKKNKVELSHYLAFSAVLLPLAVFCSSIGLNFIILPVILFLGLQLYFTSMVSAKLFVHLGFLLTLIVVASFVIIGYTTASPLYIPVAGVGMLVVLLYGDLHLAFLMALISSLFVSLITGLNIVMMLTFFLGSLAGIYTIKDARTRGDIILAGFCVAVVNIACSILIYPNHGYILSRPFLEENLYPLLANGFISAFVVMATSKIFEYLFGVLTNFSLIELADRNRPLLKQMALEAPGT